MRILLSCLVLGALVSWADASNAACGGSSPNRIAASVARGDVNDCVTAAASGDTIIVPAGSATWSSPIALPATKDLTLQGSTVVTCTGTDGTSSYSCTATDNTNLTCGSLCFVVDLSRTQRITGFTMRLSGGNMSSGNQASGKHFRFDHNHWIGTSSFTQVWLGGGSNAVHPQGVIDHNLVKDCAFRPVGTYWQWDDNPNDVQHKLWAQQPAFGGGDGRVFIEANHFKHDASGIQSSDSNYGGRYVYRFNLVDSGFHNSEVHGMQGENRGSQHTEIYHNVITTTSGCSGGTTNFRGGTGVIFNNSQAVACSYGIDFTIDRSEYDESAGNFGSVRECGVGGPDGNSPSGVDQQTPGTNGWRCRDQVGVWYDATEWDHVPSFLAWNQVTHPVYVWGNKTGASAMSITVNTQGDIENKIVAGREFYCDAGFSGGCGNGVRVGTSLPGTCTIGQAYWKADEGGWNGSVGGTQGRLYRCVASNTWALYYTPHAYPHPWTLGAESGLGVPNNLRDLR